MIHPIYIYGDTKSILTPVNRGLQGATKMGLPPLPRLWSPLRRRIPGPVFAESSPQFLGTAGCPCLATEDSGSPGTGHRGLLGPVALMSRWDHLRSYDAVPLGPEEGHLTWSSPIVPGARVNMEESSLLHCPHVSPSSVT